MPLPVLAAAGIWAFISSIITPIVKAVIVSLGVSLVIFGGLEIVFDQIYAKLMLNVNNFPAAGLYVFKAVGFQTAMNQWFGAIAGVMVYKSITAGPKIMWKKPL
jgi:hypothetical protein